ncbi:hypothetical protein ACTWQF_07190 [Streptomyces sp. 8N114]
MPVAPTAGSGGCWREIGFEPAGCAAPFGEHGFAEVVRGALGGVGGDRCDGYHGVVRRTVTESARSVHERSCPYSWLGIPVRHAAAELAENCTGLPTGP